jgi:hypothetical protein
LHQTEGGTELQISIRIYSDHVHSAYPLAWIQLEELKSARRKLNELIDKLVKEQNSI